RHASRGPAMYGRGLAPTAGTAVATRSGLTLSSVQARTCACGVGQPRSAHSATGYARGATTTPAASVLAIVPGYTEAVPSTRMACGVCKGTGSCMTAHIIDGN